MKDISCTCDIACPVHGHVLIDENEIMALNRAISRAQHHLEETRRNWTPGIPEAEADCEALLSLFSRIA